MTIKSRTIDDLGMEPSVRYARDKETLDTRLLEESKWIPKMLEVSVTKPYVPSEFDALFSSARTVEWAFFAPPPNYEMQTRALFSYQLIPSLGSYEKQEADTEKLTSMKSIFPKREREDKEGQKKRQQSGDQEKDEEQERQTLLVLFQCIEKLDRALTLINARRNQYQRG